MERVHWPVQPPVLGWFVFPKVMMCVKYHAVSCAFQQTAVRDQSLALETIPFERTRVTQLNTRLLGEERVDVGLEYQWIDDSSIADRDPVLAATNNG